VYTLFGLYLVKGMDNDEARLLEDILGNYDKKLRPVIKKQHNVTVKLGLTLNQIIDVVSKQLQ